MNLTHHALAAAAAAATARPTSPLSAAQMNAMSAAMTNSFLYGAAFPSALLPRLYAAGGSLFGGGCANAPAAGGAPAAVMPGGAGTPADSSSVWTMSAALPPHSSGPPPPPHPHPLGPPPFGSSSSPFGGAPFSSFFAGLNAAGGTGIPAAPVVIPGTPTAVAAPPPLTSGAAELAQSPYVTSLNAASAQASSNELLTESGHRVHDNNINNHNSVRPKTGSAIISPVTPPASHSAPSSASNGSPTRTTTTTIEQQLATNHHYALQHKACKINNTSRARQVAPHATPLLAPKPLDRPSERRRRTFTAAAAGADKDQDRNLNHDWRQLADHATSKQPRPLSPSTRFAVAVAVVVLGAGRLWHRCKWLQVLAALLAGTANRKHERTNIKATNKATRVPLQIINNVLTCSLSAGQSQEDTRTY
ncbi:hypothetical protein GZH46_01195, partial [Fragariocoptes setiger]